METLICRRGAPWSPRQLERYVDRLGVSSILVEHWDMRDQQRAMIDAGTVDASSDLRVQAFHDGVEPSSRACEHCGTIVGTPRRRTGALKRLQRISRR